MSDEATDPELDEASRDLAFMLAPADDIHRRVEPAEFIGYVAGVVQAVAAHVAGRPAGRSNSG